jgi:alpha/beta superfamily hydrolase
MLRALKSFVVDGPAGPIEIAVDAPPASARVRRRGVVLVGHPHPLFGGTRDNKVAVTLARAFVDEGWVAVRPNFRGVGRSGGLHDNGRGETEDFLHLIDTRDAWLAAAEPAAVADRTLALAGFSFGSFVAAQTACALLERGVDVTALVLAGAAAGKWPMPTLPVALRARTLLVHSEHDDTIALAEVFNWARPQELAVLVFPGGDHFFHRRLTALRDAVIRHLGAVDRESRAHKDAQAHADASVDAAQ